MKKITILGCGAYGLALATILEKKNQVTVYTKFENEKEEVEMLHSRESVLPGIVLPHFTVTCSKEEALKEGEIVILAVPFSVLKETFLEIQPFLSEKALLVIAAKGLDIQSGKTAYELLKEETSHPILVLSGPTFALDLAHFEPAVLTLAAEKKEDYQCLKDCFPTSVFLEYSSDLLGVSYCGAMKNIFAILYGYLEGKKVSTTSKAAVLYRSLMELYSILQQLGCFDLSVLKASGIADFYMTAESCQSRNHTLGVLLATQSKEEVDAYLEKTTVEGVTTLKACLSLMKRKNINSPIFSILDRLIQKEDYEVQTILEAFEK